MLAFVGGGTGGNDCRVVLFRNKDKGPCLKRCNLVVDCDDLAFEKTAKLATKKLNGLIFISTLPFINMLF
ncbi:hypothetical protein DID74_01130 [Candidatus Marinamargulisbacteria bacterium SCGC AG-333-B06]|nr:hypothetical protein DID74_01130 [Candidatus Marinamargulisbacteria bacterium SCGC AG-333-B06]